MACCTVGAVITAPKRSLNAWLIGRHRKEGASQRAAKTGVLLSGALQTAPGKPDRQYLIF
jgi:hypothetical protein